MNDLKFACLRLAVETLHEGATAEEVVAYAEVLWKFIADPKAA